MFAVAGLGDALSQRAGYSPRMSREFKLFGGWHQTPATVWSVAPGSSARRTVIITYTVHRRPYSSQLKTVRPFTEGQVFSLRYDPANPRRNELSVRHRARQTAISLGVLSVLATIFLLTF